MAGFIAFNESPAENGIYPQQFEEARRYIGRLDLLKAGGSRKCVIISREDRDPFEDIVLLLPISQVFEGSHFDHHEVSETGCCADSHKAVGVLKRQRP